MFETLGKCGDIYGIYFHESLSLELAKDLTLFSVEDMEWGSSIHELQNADNGFISFLGVLDRKTLQELQVLVGKIILSLYKTKSTQHVPLYQRFYFQFLLSKTFDISKLYFQKKISFK